MLDGDNNLEHMREQVKRVMVESAREVRGSVRVPGKNPKSVWWNDEIKAEVRRKEAAMNDETKERYMEAYKAEERKVKRCIIQSKKKANEQFRRERMGM